MIPSNLPAEYKENISTLTSALLRTSHSDLVSKIYLFGSCARGDIGKHSDIDICVILSTKPTTDIAVKTGIDADRIMDSENAPLFEYDIKFGTEKDLAYTSQFSVFRNIDKEGVVLYEAG